VMNRHQLVKDASILAFSVQDMRGRLNSYILMVKP
jgi:hypothetical protein